MEFPFGGLQDIVGKAFFVKIVQTYNYGKEKKKI